jgi:tetratricopeptide (TPR) repeat protein
VKQNLNKIGTGVVLFLALSIALPSFSSRDDKRYDYFFLEAARQQAADNYTGAFELYQHALRIKPDAAECYYYLALYYSMLQQDSLVLQNLQKATSLNPENATYAQQLAGYYLDKKEYDKAIDAYEDLYAHNHNNTDALRLLLQLYQQNKDYKKMLSTVNRLEIAEGESEQFTLTKMRVYEMMDDQKAAYAELKSLVVAHPLDASYKTMLGNWLMQHNRKKEAYKLFQDVLKDEPDNAYAQTSLYDYYNAVGQEKDATDMLDRILLGKNTDSDTKMMMLRAFLQNNDAEGGDSTKVLSLFDRMVSQPKPSADIAELRAVYMDMKKLPEDSVIAAYRKVLDIAPDKASSRLQLVQYLWNKKDFDGVISTTASAHEYNPEEMVFYYYGGMAYYQKEDEEATLREFRNGLAQVNGESSPALVSDLYMITGDILVKQKKQAEAYAAYDSCLQWKEDNVAALNNYAYYLSLDNRDLQRAELMSYKAIKAEPKNATYLDTYAWILFMEERYAEAKTYMDQTLANLDSVSGSAAVYEHAGDIYAMNGLTDQAVELWQKASDNAKEEEKTDVLAWKLQNRQYITEEQLKKKKEGPAKTVLTNKTKNIKKGKKK